MGNIRENVGKILNELPKDVELMAAVKERTAEEILEAINAGVKIIGENYIQETERIFSQIEKKSPFKNLKDTLQKDKELCAVKWHFIGHLQKNKVKKAVKKFDMIQTVDSFEIAKEIDKECGKISKVIPVLIEVNSGREKNKFGVFPENVKNLIEEISLFKNLKIMGLMTMGPFLENPEDIRPYFKETRRIFKEIALLELPNTQMKYLSMGMSDSYRVAIEERANIVRIGSKIFGERHYDG